MTGNITNATSLTAAVPGQHPDSSTPKLAPRSALHYFRPIIPLTLATSSRLIHGSPSL